MPPEIAPALRDIMTELAASGVEIRSPEDLERALAVRPDLQARLEVVTQRASGGPAVPPVFQADLQRAQEAEQRYLRTGDRTALDTAASAWERILDHPDFAHARARFQLAASNNAGGVFLRRYWSAGQLADLNRALALWQQAVAATPPDSPDLPSILSNLGTGLSDRYARTGQLADLEEAIPAYQHAVGRTPADSPDLPSILNNLGTGLSMRYARTGRLEDLEAAIDAYQRAEQHTPADSPDLPSILNNLGNGLHDRYARTGQLADLEEAIRLYETAVAHTPEDHPNLTVYLLSLGAALIQRYVITYNSSLLQSATDHLQKAITLSLISAPHVVQKATRTILEVTKQLIVQDKANEAGTLVAHLQAVIGQPNQPNGERANQLKSEEEALLRDPSATYRTASDRLPVDEQSLGLLRDVLSIASSVATIRSQSDASSAYAAALQALEFARQNDRRTGAAFNLAQWVRDVTGFEFLELEDADEWPPRVAYLVHLAARHERDGNWEAAIGAYQQACELLGTARSERQLARSAEVGFRLALCLKQAGRWTEALKQQEANVAAYKELGDVASKANAYIEMGHIYQMMNLYDPALLYYGEAYYLYRETAEETTDEETRRTAQHGMANTRESLGNLEFQLKVLPQGISDLEEARALYLDLGMPGKAAIIAQTLGDGSGKQGGQHA